VKEISRELGVRHTGVESKQASEECTCQNARCASHPESGAVCCLALASAGLITRSPSEARR
jgi:hypothetical protein